ncbi:MAG TPA: hypothetical protein VIK01_07465 [Polyangiaceae bacterium]
MSALVPLVTKVERLIALTASDRVEEARTSALAIHVDFGIPVMWAGNRDNAANITERLLMRLWRKSTAEAAA